MTPLTKREIKDIKSLAGKKGRTHKNRFVAEGVRVIEEAVNLDRRPEAGKAIGEDQHKTVCCYLGSVAVH